MSYSSFSDAKDEKLPRKESQDSKKAPGVRVVIRKKSTGKIRRRVLDDEGFIRRVASVCVNEDESRVLLISSKKDSKVWLIPGGGIEESEEEFAAATREAWEEAGVRGRVGRRLGIFESVHPTGKKKHRTSAFVYVVSHQEDDFPEAYLGRKRKWFTVDDASLILSRFRPLQRPYIDRLRTKEK
ncbi:UNVERIFIED_CONTAM: hypothetical protein RMT77_001752 [Armadillidium vulgare]